MLSGWEGLADMVYAPPSFRKHRPGQGPDALTAASVSAGPQPPPAPAIPPWQPQGGMIWTPLVSVH